MGEGDDKVVPWGYLHKKEDNSPSQYATISISLKMTHICTASAPTRTPPPPPKKKNPLRTS